MATSPMADQVGRVLGGRYRLLAPIGTGASAHVYVAEDVDLRRRVAVKVLHAALAEDESFLRRFRAEAQNVAALRHPNIMTLFDWGDDAGMPFLVLELLEGGSLRSLLDRGHRLSPSQALQVGLDATRALDHAHRRGLVHRDIKPANLLFDDEGRLSIADFGLARALAEAAWTEPTGAVLGTARYASPEQVDGTAVTGKADVYALALVLVEAVTGNVPFAADTTIATLMGRVGRPIPVPAELGPLVPVLEQAGRPEPEERPDAAALGAALERAKRSLPAPEPLPLAGTTAAADATEPVDLTQLPARAGPFDGETATAELAAVPTGGDPSHRRHWPLVLLASVLAALLIAVGVVAVVSNRVASHPVPAVVGRSLADAQAALAARHLRLLRGPDQADEDMAAGLVLHQQPAGAVKLKEGKAVTVVLSSGPQPRTVPDLTKLDEGAAAAALAARQLKAKVVRASSETVSRGTVLDWQPRGEQPRGTEVTVTVSDGPAPRTVADLTGKTYDDAAAALRSQGLVAARVDAFNDTVAPDKVVSTSPGAGASVARGSTVKLTVSKGPAPLPDVRGKSVDEATSIMGQAGLVVVGVSGRPNRPVVQTLPPAGTPTPKGATVILVTR